MTDAAEVKRKKGYINRVGGMKRLRSSFDDHYLDLANFVTPRRGRFNNGSERNRSARSYWSEIINSRGTQALRTAQAGMFNGIMSPSRPWFQLRLEDPALTEFRPVKQYLFDTRNVMLDLFNATNLYHAAPLMLKEQIQFGTACMSHEDSVLNFAHFQTHTVGSYYIEHDDEQRVNAVAREFEMNCFQIIKKFSPSLRDINQDISTEIRTAYDNGEYDRMFKVVHFVFENPDYIPDSRKPMERKYLSVYFEEASSGNDKYLAKKGHDFFPFYCPRWDTTNEDIYGTDCPGMSVLGDVRQLQFQEKRKAQGLDKIVHPPLHGPSALKNSPIRNLPGGVTLYDSISNSQGLRSVYELNLPLQHMVVDMEKVEGRINEGYFVDLFLAISAMDGIQPRNELELTQRNQERLLQLGPVLEREFTEFLDPLIERTYIQAERAGLLPPLPPELDNDNTFITPKYVSSLAIAQRMVATGAIERLANFTGALAGLGFEEALDRFDVDEAVDEWASLSGVPPSVVVPVDEAQQVREARARERQRIAAIEAGQGVAQIARTAGDTNTGEGTAASDLAEAVGG